MSLASRIIRLAVIAALNPALSISLCAPLFADSPAVGDFFEPNRVFRPKISGNGRFLVYQWEKKEKEILRVLDLKGDQHGDLPVPDGRFLLNFDWVGTDNLLLCRIMGYNALATWYVYDVEKREYLNAPNYLSTYEINDLWEQDPGQLVLQRLDDGLELIVYHQDIEGKKPPRKVSSTPPDTMIVLCDPVTGIPKIAATSERYSYHTFMSTERKGLERIFFKSDSEADWKHLPYFDSNYSDYRNVYGSKVILGLGPQGKILYYGQKTEHDTLGIYAYNLESMEPLDCVASNPKYDLVHILEFNMGNLGRRNDNLVFSQKRNVLVGVRDRAIYERVLWRDPLFQCVQEAVDSQLPPRRINEIYDWNRDETVFLVSSFSDRVFDEYYLFNLEKKTLSRIGASMPDLPEEACGPEIALQIPLRDGAEMLAYFRYPAGRQQQKVPVIVEIPDTQMRWDWNNSKEMQARASMGYATLRIHPRGRPGFGKAFFEKGFEHGGEVLLQDIEDAIAFCVQKAYIDSDRIAIHAEQDGAFLALHAMSRNPGMFSAAVLSWPLTSMDDYLRKSSYMRKRLQRWDLFELIKEIEKQSEFDGDSFVSLRRATAGLETPILIVGSPYGKDEKELKRILKKRKVEHQLFRYVDYIKDTVDYESVKAAVEIFEMQMQFIEKHFAGGK